MPLASYVKACKTVVAGTEEFQNEVVKWLETIGSTTLGATMLRYFGTAAPSKLVKSPTEDVALVVLQFGLKKGDTNAPICTKTCIDWEDRTAHRPKGLNDTQFKQAQKIPLVRIPPSSWKLNGGKLEVKDGVLLGHDDFAKTGAEMDVVLFHELCHAYLISSGLSPKWDGRQFTRAKGILSVNKIGVDVAVEEQIVCGLLHGRGLDCCENAYRVQRKLTPRLSYKAVGLALDQQLEANFNDTWSTGVSSLTEGAKLWGSKIAYVLAQNGYPGNAKNDFGDAKQVTDLGLLNQKDEAPKLEKKNSLLGLDASNLPPTGDVNV
jgi:hypothetical protein